MRPFRFLKRILPHSLFGRSLLILVLPTLLVLAMATYMFYERHWSTVTRHMSASLAGDVAFLVYRYEGMSPNERKVLQQDASDLMGIHMMPLRQPGLKPPMLPKDSPYGEFADRLNTLLDRPFTIRDSDDDLLIRVRSEDGVLLFRVSQKRLVSSSTYIYLFWVVGTAILLMVIAMIFLRNQIRPIRRLAEAAESFGRGHDMPQFRPGGAQEVRRAARAFITMRERIKRQISTRTDMLSGISHDLRTPLTRMKLQLAMLGHSQEIQDLQADVQAMQRMVQEYLDFARGEGREEALPVNLNALLQDIVQDFARQKQKVELSTGEDVAMSLRPDAMRRCLTNLIDNAVRYGKRAHISTRIASDFTDVVIDDEGPGIPRDRRDDVFKAFRRLDDARTPEKGGVGLGLTIARDIVLGHGGKIFLEDAPMGGLRVVVRLPS